MSIQKPLTIDEAAEHFGVHPDTVRRWIEDGELEAFTVNANAKCTNRRLRIEWEAIQKFKQKRTLSREKSHPLRVVSDYEDAMKYLEQCGVKTGGVATPRAPQKRPKSRKTNHA